MWRQKIAKFEIKIEAEIIAQNFDKAQAKCDDIKKRVERGGVEWAEVHLSGKTLGKGIKNNDS